MSPEARPAVLRTERVLLRPFVQSDAEDVFAYAQLEEWSRYHVPEIPYPYARSDADEFIASMLETSWENKANWAIVINERVVGGLTLSLRPPASRAELGYSLAPDHWNRGITTEAARAVLSYAFYVWVLDTVEARADARNVGSRRVMEKVGMARISLEADVRRDRAGAVVDQVRYAVTRSR